MPVCFNLFVTAFHDLCVFFSIMYLLVLGYYNHVSLKFIIIIILFFFLFIFFTSTLTYHCLAVPLQRNVTTVA